MTTHKKLLIATMTIGTNVAFSQTLKHEKSTLSALHLENKDVQTKMFFPANDSKVVSLQIQKDKQLKEHITPIPALLVCVKGEVVFEDENGVSLKLESGDFVKIQPNIKHWVNAKIDSNLLLIK